MESAFIEKEWRKFCLACFGNISDQQYIDLRRTFYGGIAALLSVQLNQLEGGDEATENDLAMMHSIQDELIYFNDEVKAGRA